MNHSAAMTLAPMLFAAGIGFASQANAATQVVSFNVLNASATVTTPLGGGDSLRLNTLVTTEVGALLQSITFTVAAGVDSFTGEAAWEVTPAAGAGPRLVGVNIDILDSSNTVIASDTFQGLQGNFATSLFAGSIAPGTYTLVATSNGVRDASLDATLTFAVPEPQSLALMAAGLGVIGFAAWRRSRSR